MFENAIPWNIFEITVHIFAVFLLLELIFKSLGNKNQNKNRSVGFILACVATLGVFIVEDLFHLLGENWMIMVVVCILYIYAHFCLLGSVVQKVVVCFVSYSLISLSASLVLLLCGTTYDQDYTILFEPNSSRVFYLLFTKIVQYLFARGIIYFVQKAELFDWQWSIAALTFMFSMLTSNEIIVQFQNKDTTEAMKLEMLGLAVAIWIIIIITFLILTQLSRSNLLQRENDLLKRSSEHQITMFRQMIESNNDMKHIKHDIKNHLVMISLLINDGKIDEATQYCESIIGQVENIPSVFSTGIPTIDVLFDEKIAKNQLRGIEIECSVDTDFQNIDTFAFCSVFSNLMDNAVEATELLLPSKQFIKVRILEHLGKLNLIIMNNIGSPVLHDDNELVTSKKDKISHGIGHKSVRHILIRIGGSIRYLEEKDNFTVIAVFPKNDPESLVTVSKEEGVSVKR